MTKKKFIKPFAILAAVFLGSLEMGWRFFNMVVRCKRGEQKKERKKERNGLNCLISGKIIHRTVMPENIMRVRHGALNRICRTVISKVLTD